MTTQQVDFFHRLLLLDTAGLTVGRVAPHDHRFESVLLCDVGRILEHAVDPARNRDALGVHDMDILTLGLLVTAGVETALDPFVVEIPHP